MAVVRISQELIAEYLFKGLDVQIRDARMVFASDCLEFSITGDDVPDCTEAIITHHQFREPGCDPHVKVEITAT